MLGIPVVAILDSNVNPHGIAFPVPGNDDASRAIRLYCDAVREAATKGGRANMAASGMDMGALDEPVEEPALVEEAPVAEAPVAEALASEVPAASAPAEDAQA